MAAADERSSRGDEEDRRDGRKTGCKGRHGGPSTGPSGEFRFRGVDRSHDTLCEKRARLRAARLESAQKLLHFRNSLFFVPCLAAASKRVPHGQPPCSSRSSRRSYSLAFFNCERIRCLARKSLTLTVFV